MSHSIEDISNLVKLFNSQDDENFKVALQIAQGMDLPASFFRGLIKTKYAALLCLQEGFVQPLLEVETLDLSLMVLRELPESLNKLTQLKGLKLDYHQLETLPTFIGDLVHLESLELLYGKLKQLPDSIINLTRLKALDIRQNHLTKLPKALWQMSHLEYIALSSNHLPSETIEGLRQALPHTHILA